jgi:flagellar export protein FliJ
MKAFRFPLQAILTLREEQEQEAQRGYAQALREVDAVRAAVAGVEGEIAGSADEQAARLRNGTPASELQRLAGYRMVLELRLQSLRADLERVHRASEEARLRLLKAAQNRQALEKYRDKLQRVHAAHVARSERNQLDDLAGRTSTLATAWRQATSEPVP